jgi:multidrug efflux pump subunit AcrA (membrane-fusion protein)
MNAAFTTGQAGVGEMTPARTPVRPLRLVVALLVAAAAVGVGGLTYQAVAARTASFSGQVTPAHAYFLNFANSGTLRTVAVRPGQHVTAGQVLATEDNTVDQANLQAAQAELAADTTELAADQNPQLGPQQQSQNQVELTKAQQAVNTAQTSLTLAQNAAQNTITAQGAAVTGRQNVLDSDTTHFNEVCSGTTPNASADTCAALQAQIVKDNADLANAQAQLASAQSAARAQQDRDAGQLSSAQATLAAVQNRAATTTVPVTPATVAQARSNLALAQAKVATDEELLRQDSITAPGDGIVADTAGAAGDVVGAGGVHGYGGPAAESGTLSAQQSSGFQLFVQPAAPGGGSTQNATFAPVITLYTGPMTVMAQLPEETIGGTHIGQHATLAVTALNRTVGCTVSQVLLDPARVPGATFYDVVISMDTQPAQVLAGMTVHVTLN